MPDDPLTRLKDEFPDEVARALVLAKEQAATIRAIRLKPSPNVSPTIPTKRVRAAAEPRPSRGALIQVASLNSVAAAAVEQALVGLKEHGEGNPPMFDFKEFCGLIGFQDVWDFEKKWAR